MSNPNRKGLGGIASGAHYFTGDGDQENLRVSEHDEETKQAARKAVCHYAADARDAREMLDMLGLLEGT